MSLQDAINSASSVAQNLTSELADGQRKLLALASGNPKPINPMVVQQSNGSIVGLPEMVAHTIFPHNSWFQFPSCLHSLIFAQLSGIFLHLFLAGPVCSASGGPSRSYKRIIKVDF